LGHRGGEPIQRQPGVADFSCNYLKFLRNLASRLPDGAG
jgi:hypothetical protein